MTSEARSIPRYKIDSSGIESAGYDEARRILAIEFKPKGGALLGLVLHYDNVPADVKEAFETAESRGRYYAANIRGKFTARGMTGLCSECAMDGYIGETCEHCKKGTVREVDRYRKDGGA